MTLRVAQIIGNLAIGGAERHLVNLLNAMTCEFRAVICVAGKPVGQSFENDLDTDIERYHVRIQHRNVLLGILRLALVLRRCRINVVHTHMYASNLYGTIAARLAGVPVIVTSEHGENPWKGAVRRWLERHVISAIADARFCVSPRILEIRRNVDGIPASKLRLIVNGTPIPTMPPRARLNTVPIIGAVGRFIPAKNYPGLLRAIAELRRRGYELELYIVGDGAESGRVRDLIVDLGLEGYVKLPGMVSDMDNWYRRFDVYVSSSSTEGLPVALLEAMAHGLPVVATDVGAASETVRHGEGGLIVPRDDPGALADALGRLLDDSQLRESLGSGARERIQQHYSVESVADIHEKAYHELLSSKGLV